MNFDPLCAMEAVLRDAIETVEFTRLPKDLAYAQLVAEKIETIRGGDVKITLDLIGGKIYKTVEVEGIPRWLNT